MIKQIKKNTYDRRDFIKGLGAGMALTLFPFSKSLMGLGNNPWYVAGLNGPKSVYITWGSHDQLSDNVQLTESLAMKQLDEMIRLRNAGMKFDYYLMDMFWFDNEKGYREFNPKNWPDGPDAWIKKCKENGIEPGLWLSSNVMGWGNMRWMKPLDEWKDSSCWNDSALCLFYGGYLSSMLNTMQMWYDKGIRMFKFDFANFSAAPDHLLLTHTEKEIVELNENAWFSALKIFRQKNPEIVMLAYNGYGGQQYDTDVNIRKTIDLKWLEVFDSLYCGDPRPADVPCFNFWRSKDIYSCHMVFQYQKNGVPLKRIDNSAFMIGTTGTCYYRGKEAWKGMLILSGARGGWMNTYYGNLDLLSNEDALWAARVQDMFYEMQEFGRFNTFGELPGSAKPYGFICSQREGELITVVNPSQQIQHIKLPGSGKEKARVLFADAGFEPILNDDTLVLGPEQMALVGFGKYAGESFYLGLEEDVQIPSNIQNAGFVLNQVSPGIWSGDFTPEHPKRVRIVFRLTDAHKKPLRISGGELAHRVSIGERMKISVKNRRVTLPLEIKYDKKIWSGLSWAVAELQPKDFTVGKPLKIEFTADPLQAQGAIVDTNIYYVE